MLTKDGSDPSHVLEYELLELREDITYTEQPVQMLDPKEHIVDKNNLISELILEVPFTGGRLHGNAKRKCENTSRICLKIKIRL